eukprot:gene9056-9136_t
MRLDLPLPETPVIPISFPSGKSTDTFLRLCPVAFFKLKTFPLPSRLFLGMAISRSPLM